MDNILIIFNALAGLVVMWYAAGKLGNKQYGDWDAGLYVHSCVLVSAMVVVYDSLAYTRAHHWSEVCFNAAVAMYFVRRMWRRWYERKHTIVKHKPHVKLLIKKGLVSEELETIMELKQKK